MPFHLCFRCCHVVPRKMSSQVASEEVLFENDSRTFKKIKNGNEMKPSHSQSGSTARCSLDLYDCIYCLLMWLWNNKRQDNVLPYTLQGIYNGNVHISYHYYCRNISWERTQLKQRAYGWWYISGSRCSRVWNPIYRSSQSSPCFTIYLMTLTRALICSKKQNNCVYSCLPLLTHAYNIPKELFNIWSKRNNEITQDLPLLNPNQ